MLRGLVPWDYFIVHPDSSAICRDLPARTTETNSTSITDLSFGRAGKNHATATQTSTHQTDGPSGVIAHEETNLRLIIIMIILHPI